MKSHNLLQLLAWKVTIKTHVKNHTHMLRRPATSSLVSRPRALLTRRRVCGAISSAVVGPALTCRPLARPFSTDGRMTEEYGFGSKFSDVPVMTGKAKAMSRDGDWVCAFPLTERMTAVVPQVLRRAGFSDTEIGREMKQIFGYRDVDGPLPSTQVNVWTSVEEFQRTPWYRRWRPGTSTACTYISYEAMKALEAALVPPSLRSDPYAHLRKRHLEDQHMNERFTENFAKQIRRDDLNRVTKGTAEFEAANPTNKISRRKFLEFDRRFKEASVGGGVSSDSPFGSYHAWMESSRSQK